MFAGIHLPDICCCLSHKWNLICHVRTKEIILVVIGLWLN